MKMVKGSSFDKSVYYPILILQILKVRFYIPNFNYNNNVIINYIICSFITKYF